MFSKQPTFCNGTYYSNSLHKLFKIMNITDWLILYVKIIILNKIVIAYKLMVKKII